MARKINTSQPAVDNAAGASLTGGTTLQWDASSGICHDVELHQILAHGHLPAFRVKGVPLTDPGTSSYWPGGEMCLAPAFLSQTPVAARTSTGMIFSMAAALLGTNGREMISRTTGKLAWFFLPKQTEPPPSAVYPVLLGYDAGGIPTGALPERERITIIPSLQACDPLQHHIALVLQTAVAARGRAEQLYVETLADALVLHFLRRYAASRPVLQKLGGGFVPYKLRRTLTYIQAHLAQRLSLDTLADVAQMSPTHFAHLFKRATGLAPHRYVILRRIEHAKWLLGETDRPLIDIGPEVGFSDQSHFTALFRKYVSMTPKTYRDLTWRCDGSRRAVSARQ